MKLFVFDSRTAMKQMERQRNREQCVMRPLQGRSTQYSQRVLFNKVGEMNSCEQDIRNQLRYGRRFVQFARQSEHVQSTPVQRCWPPSLPPPRPGSAEFARLTPDGDRLNKTCPSGAVCSQPSSSLSICRAIIIKPIERVNSADSILAVRARHWAVNGCLSSSR